MNPNHLIMLALAIGLSVSSCTNATKKAATEDNSILGKLSESNKLDEETISELKDIANDPNSSLPVEDNLAPDIEFASMDGVIEPELPPQSAPATVDPTEKWSANGMNPTSVNPGDIFSESMGPILNKTLSLYDEISETERNTILAQIASHSSKRNPITFSQREINTLRSQVPQEVDLPTRSVALDVKTHIRKVEPQRYELYLEKLATGDAGGSIASVEHRKKLQAQLSEVKKRLKGGEELFIVTAVTESEEIRAHFPGAPIGSRDAAPIRNAVQSLYPHLTDLDAEKEENRVILTGSPRLLWEFETKALKLKNGNVVIEKSERDVDESNLAQR